MTSMGSSRRRGDRTPHARGRNAAGRHVAAVDLRDGAARPDADGAERQLERDDSDLVRVPVASLLLLGRRLRLDRRGHHPDLHARLLRRRPHAPGPGHGEQLRRLGAGRVEPDGGDRRSRPPGQHRAAGALGNGAGRPHPDRVERKLEERLVAELLLQVGPLRLGGERLRDDLRRDPLELQGELGRRRPPPARDRDRAEQRRLHLGDLVRERRRRPGRRPAADHGQAVADGSLEGGPGPDRVLRLLGRHAADRTRVPLGSLRPERGESVRPDRRRDPAVLHADRRRHRPHR